MCTTSSTSPIVLSSLTTRPSSSFTPVRSTPSGLPLVPVAKRPVVLRRWLDEIRWHERDGLLLPVLLRNFDNEWFRWSRQAVTVHVPDGQVGLLLFVEPVRHIRQLLFRRKCYILLLKKRRVKISCHCLITLDPNLTFRTNKIERGMVYNAETFGAT